MKNDNIVEDSMINIWRNIEMKVSKEIFWIMKMKVWWKYEEEFSKDEIMNENEQSKDNGQWKRTRQWWKTEDNGPEKVMDNDTNDN